MEIGNKVSFRLTLEEQEYLQRLSQNCDAQTKTELMHKLLSECMQNGAGLSCPARVQTAFDTPSGDKGFLAGFGLPQIQGTKSVPSMAGIMRTIIDNRGKPDLASLWIEEMEKVARFKKALNDVLS